MLPHQSSCFHTHLPPTPSLEGRQPLKKGEQVMLLPSLKLLVSSCNGWYKGQTLHPGLGRKGHCHPSNPISCHWHLCLPYTSYADPPTTPVSRMTQNFPSSGLCIFYSLEFSLSLATVGHIVSPSSDLPT